MDCNRFETAFLTIFKHSVSNNSKFQNGIKSKKISNDQELIKWHKSLSANKNQTIYCNIDLMHYKDYMH